MKPVYPCPAAIHPPLAGCAGTPPSTMNLRSRVRSSKTYEEAQPDRARPARARCRLDPACRKVAAQPRRDRQGRLAQAASARAGDASSSARKLGDSSRLRRIPASVSSSSAKIERASGVHARLAGAPLRSQPLTQVVEAIVRVEDAAHDELRRADAVPTVLLQPECDVVAPRSPQPVELRPLAERDRRAGVAAALAHAEAKVLAVADGLQVGELATVDEQGDTRVAQPERREPRQLGAEAERQLRRPARSHRPALTRRDRRPRAARRRTPRRRARTPRLATARSRAPPPRDVRRSARAPTHRRRARRAGRTTVPTCPIPSSSRRRRRSGRPAGCTARRAARRRCRSRPRATPAPATT